MGHLDCQLDNDCTHCDGIVDSDEEFLETLKALRADQRWHECDQHKTRLKPAREDHKTLTPNLTVTINTTTKGQFYHKGNHLILFKLMVLCICAPGAEV